jgi:SAM-dependent methyltransferase
VYDELFRRVPDHPQLSLKLDAKARQDDLAQRLAILKNYLRSDETYLEIGPGDCSLAREVAKLTRKVYAVDVSNEITKGIDLPDNVELIISDGSSIPVPNDSVDLAYSDQLMEHLHPEDAIDQLRNIYRSLAAGGRYICITPNRLSGPHDVSQYFDDVATGFHLKEYTMTELSEMFRDVGFRKLQVLVGARGFHIKTPTLIIKLLESILARVPHRLGRTFARGLPLRLILGVKLVGIK